MNSGPDGRLPKLKHLFENRRWAELEEALGSPEVWLLDSFVSVREAIERAQQQCEGCEDLHLSIERILHNEASGPEPRASYRCSLAWRESNGGGQRRHFDLHLGLDRPGRRIAYLGVTSPTAAISARRGSSIPFLPVWAAGEDAPEDHVLVYMPVWVPAGVARTLLESEPESDS